MAISEVGVYLGGHFSWMASPTAEDASPGLDNVGYGTGQGLSGYGLGDDVVRRDHIGVINPTDGQGARVEPDVELLRRQQGDARHPTWAHHRW